MSDPTPPPATPVAPAPKSSGSKVVLIIVCVVIGFFLLIGGCVATCTYIAAKKVHQAAKDMHDKPVYTSILWTAKANPDVDVISTDDGAAKITVRNKKTGAVVTIDANDYTSDTVSKALEKMTQGLATAARSAQAAAAGADPAVPNTSGISSGKAAALEDIVRKFPASAPSYPGAATQDATLNAVGNVRTEQYSFLTLDKIDAVLDFYEGKGKDAGYGVVGRQGSTNDAGPTGTLTLSRTHPPGAITVTVESHAGNRLAVSVTLTETGN